jgi:hypothetical protein
MPGAGVVEGHPGQAVEGNRERLRKTLRQQPPEGSHIPQSPYHSQEEACVVKAPLRTPGNTFHDAVTRNPRRQSPRASGGQTDNGVFIVREHRTAGETQVLNVTLLESSPCLRS